MQQNNGVDKKQLISFGLLTLVLMAFMFYYNSKKEPAEQQKPAPTETVKKEQTDQAKEIAAIQQKAEPGSIKQIQLKNSNLTVDFSTLGGQISTVRINKYNAYDEKSKDKPVLLFANNNASYGFQFKDKSNKVINTKDLVFSESVDGNVITMQSNVGNATIQFIYTLYDNYKIDFKVRTKNLSSVVNDNKADFVWNYKVREMEKGRSQEQSHTEFVYTFNNYKSYDYDGRTDMGEPKEVLNWIGVKQQFFGAIIESQSGFSNSKGYQEPIEEGDYLKSFNFDGQVNLVGSEINQDFTWYFLPLDLPLLKSYDKNFKEILPLGWSFIGWLNRGFFIPVFNWLSSLGIAAGWVIFWMTIAVKIILSPIMYKQHKLSAMMRVIRPEIEEVQAKYKNADAMKKQQATMEVYRKAGVNQFAGCIPGLVQIPIFYALFRFFPNMIDLRDKSFWFAQNLTAYDDLIKLPFHVPLLGDHLSVFALACTVVILIYTIMTAGNMQQPTQEGMPNMKPLLYIFPITFLFFLNSAASGLSWYYFVSNFINIIIILVIKYVFLNEKKIHAQIEINKAKPKKEGKFQARMRQMMEKAQEQQKRAEEMKKQQKNKKK